MNGGSMLGRLMARPWFFTLWTVVATFGCYACMYGFRKPFTAAGFGGPDAKAWLVTAQVLGYAVSKFIGIKVIAEMSPASRSRTLLAIIGCAQAMLLLFALAPPYLDAVCLFGNGLALGMVFGLVLGFVEGRQLTELFVAGLCASFILADGVAKTVGAALLHRGVAERWMPCTAGMLFLLPLIAFVWMLGRIPPPSWHDELARSHRPPMTVAERLGLLRRHGVGLLAIVVAYLLITILRSIRGDFAPEIWTGLGIQPQAAVFTQSELWVALVVVAANGALVLVQDNRRAFFIGLLLSGGGMVLGLVSLGAYLTGLLSPFAFMVVLGAGMYVPYVAVHTTVFERLIGLTRERANLGFLMYLADASGYLGYVAVMLGRSLFPDHEQFLGFFIGTAGGLLGAALACVLAAMWIYSHRIGSLAKTSVSCSLVLLLGAGLPANADETFTTTVAPVLRRHCLDCHGADTQEGDLRLDTLGHDLASPRITARWRDIADRIRAGDMPPKEQPRPEAAETAAVLEWIDRGIAATSSGRSHWAFQPLREIAVPAPPDDRRWVRTEIDRFVLASLQAAGEGSPSGLSPSAEANRVTLIRRVTFDLIGLPPTPEEVAAFVADTAPDAWERVVDRLLASPHYGERWGRHWLDLAQYADSSGFHDDLDRPHAWKYRDYVIRSFNDDKPYGRFVAEQLAGDEIEGADADTFIATGFCRNGPSNDNNMGKTKEAQAQYRADQLDTVISNVGTVFLGLTIGCARCHNHKTEPLSSRDYYSLLAIFNGAEKHGLVPGTEDAQGKKVPIDPALKIQAFVERSAKVPPAFIMRRGLASNPGDEVGPAVPAVLVSRPLEFPAADPDASSSGRRRTLAAWIAAADNPLTWRVLANRIWQHHFGRGLVVTPSNFGVSGAAPTHPELLDWLASRLVADGGRIKPLHRLILCSASYRQDSHDRDDCLRVDPGNTRLWRMNVQRLEAEAIRDAILAASGSLNLKPGGPGIKPRIRPELLTASQRNKWPSIGREHDDHWRRSVYIYVKRQLLLPMMELFDAPTTTDSCAARMVSVVPTQALLLMNDEFVEDQAGHLADRAIADAGDDLPQAVGRMFALALSRPPDEARLGEAVAFVRARESAGDRRAALTDLAHVLFNSSEFLYVE